MPVIAYEQFQKNLTGVRERLSAACRRAGRDEREVALLPVTKNHSAEAVLFVSREGLPAVGESRVREAASKREAIDEALPMRWDMIGHLQSNKAKQAVAVFDRIQSVDSLKLIERLNRCAAEVNRVLPILLQCNSGRDEAKYGFLPEDMESALERALGASNLKVEGFMTIAPMDDDPSVARAAFFELRELRDRLAATNGVELPELSMGMTGDLEAAVEAGSTEVRVGTALFGER
ncbi:MAG: YggS family pyridoxal phosphate-dependent enzyme [Opitutales bacterium]